MTLLSDALASRAREAASGHAGFGWMPLDERPVAGLDAAVAQRARVLDAVWAALVDGIRPFPLRPFPPALLPRVVRRCAEIVDYAVDLAHAPDGSWRVVRDCVGDHPGAAVLEMPVLAVFLPELCRDLLGQTLSLPSMPIWWLGDRATLHRIRTEPNRYRLGDAVDPSRPSRALGTLPAADRSILQRDVDRMPVRFVVTLHLQISCTNRHRLT